MEIIWCFPAPVGRYLIGTTPPNAQKILNRLSDRHSAWVLAKAEARRPAVGKESSIVFALSGQNKSKSIDNQIEINRESKREEPELRSNKCCLARVPACYSVTPIAGNHTVFSLEWIDFAIKIDCIEKIGRKANNP